MYQTIEALAEILRPLGLENGTRCDLRHILIHYRREFGLTQKDLAAMLGVTQMTICNWEKDHYSPKRERILQLALEELKK